MNWQGNKNLLGNPLRLTSLEWNICSQQGTLGTLSAQQMGCKCWQGIFIDSKTLLWQSNLDRLRIGWGFLMLLCNSTHLYMVL
jgi:hypothetical protein